MNVDIRHLMDCAAIDSITHEEVIQLCDHIKSQAAEIERLREALHDLVSGAGAEMAPGWGCTSYHPKLVKALDKARAALSGEKA